MTNLYWNERLSLSASLLAAALTFTLVTPVVADKALASFADFGGSWSGTGILSLQNGNVESLKCKAYYTPKSDGTGVGIAIRCASASNSLELRAALTSQNRKISGSWEERTFNATGDVSGNISERRIDLAISGGGFKGMMLVTMDGSNQEVSIQTEGIALKAITISFSRT